MVVVLYLLILDGLNVKVELDCVVVDGDDVVLLIADPFVLDADFVTVSALDVASLFTVLDG